MTNAVADLVIEPLAPDGLADWLAVRNSVDLWPISPETMALRTSLETDSLRLLARRDGRILGVGSVAWEAFGGEHGDAGVRIWVLEGDRGQGVGSALFEPLARYARERGMTTIGTRVQADDEQAITFAAHRGLHLGSMQQLGVLRIGGPGGVDPASMPEPGLPDGVSIVAIAERPDLARAVYEMQAPVIPEIPSWGRDELPTWEAWTSSFEEPALIRELMLLALEGGRVLGSIEAVDDGDGRAFITLLAVAPEARRRGIARALKLELHRRAAATGWREIVTVNDGTNEPIRRLNVELGYRYDAETFLMKGPIPPG